MPPGYLWLVNQNLIGFEPFTQLQPWYFASAEEQFSPTELWPGRSPQFLWVFARRQDDDDLACFSYDDEGKFVEVVLIHGWTAEGFAILKTFPTVWRWLQSVIEDIAEWSAIGSPKTT